MNEYLKIFDTIRLVATWSIFRNFLRIFHFLNLNLKFEFGPVWNRPKSEPVRFPGHVELQRRYQHHVMWSCQVGLLAVPDRELRPPWAWHSLSGCLLMRPVESSAAVRRDSRPIKCHEAITTPVLRCKHRDLMIAVTAHGSRELL